MSFELGRRFRVLRPIDVLPRHQDEPFDLFVYHVGNSEAHIYMLELMRRFPGLTVLHDLYLGGLALQADAVGAWLGPLATDVEAEGAIELAAALRRGEGDHHRIVDEVTLSRRFIEMSEAAVVHNVWSWNRARSNAAFADTAFYLIPMGVPIPALQPIPTLRSRLGIRPQDFVVTALGEVTAAKRTNRLIRAAGSLPERIRARLQLIVVGGASADSRQELLRVARESISRSRFGLLDVFLSSIWPILAGPRTPAFSSGIQCTVRRRRLSFARCAAGSACVVSDARELC